VGDHHNFIEEEVKCSDFAGISVLWPERWIEMGIRNIIE